MASDDNIKLNAPLMEGDMLADDPFYGFRDELAARADQLSSRFDSWKHLLNSTNTAENPAFKEQDTKLKDEVSQLLTNILELEEVVYRIESNRGSFSHISERELGERKRSVLELKARVRGWKNVVVSNTTQNKLKADLRILQSRKEQAENKRGAIKQKEMNEAYIRSQQQQQSMIAQEQDGHLDDLHDSASRLNLMAGAIGEEIEDQGRMLDELGDDLEQTDNRMEHALGRMDKLLQSNNRCQTWTILTLILIAIVMFFFIVNSF